MFEFWLVGGAIVILAFGCGAMLNAPRYEYEKLERESYPSEKRGWK